jgi:transposase InsO family protein
MKYRFIGNHRQNYPVGQQCNVLGVSRSGYYAWRERQKKQEQDDSRRALIEHIRRIHKKSRRTYGSPRVHAELRAEGVICNHKRVARLMRLEGIQGRRKRRKVVTTDSRHAYPVAPNLLNRKFEAEAPNEKWVADITYIPTREGWLYLAVVMDLYARKIVGWSMSHQITADLVEDALRMALYERQPDPGLLHHSDRGSQYASEQIRRILANNQIGVSMSRTGNCYDNAVMESFFSTLKCEQVHHQDYKTRTEASRDIFEYIAGFYNTVRRHSTLGFLSPNQFEASDHNSP